MGGSLFHYTTAQGLLGILAERALWATDCRFLNDETEARYALDVFLRALETAENPARQPGHPSHDQPHAFESVFQRYRTAIAEELGSPNLPTYVACFCDSGDLLSQWRAYGADHGYAIEFSRDALLAAAKQVGTYSCDLVPVRYGQEDADDVVARALAEVSADSNLAHVGVHAHYATLRLTALMAGVKDPSFSEEREWRVVIGSEVWPGVADQGKPPVRFRVSATAVVPYIHIPLSHEAVVGVRIGPGRDTVLRKEGVRRLLMSYGHEVPISVSGVPLRL